MNPKNLDELISALDAESQTILAKFIASHATPKTSESERALIQQELVARILWSQLTEPGDAIIGHLVEEKSPGACLDIFLKSTGAKHFITHFDSEVNSRQIQTAYARWQARISANPLLETLEKTLQLAAAAAAAPITPNHQHWPQQLQKLGEAAPLLLWVKGDTRLLQRNMIAVVGARAVSQYGEEVTITMTEKLCAADQVIISGGAYGIDGIAHRTAVANNSPTVVVLAGGIDRPYPAGHASLFANVLANSGLILSETAPGTAPTRWRFLQRNRLIASLAQGVLVTEAGMRSGSINTAGHAAHIGIPLAAIPGNITSPGSSGTHLLIRDYNAELVASPTQLLEVFQLQKAAQAKQARENPIHIRVLDAIPLKTSASTEAIAAKAGLSESETVMALAELNLLQKAQKVYEAGRECWRLRT